MLLWNEKHEPTHTSSQSKIDHLIQIFQTDILIMVEPEAMMWH